MEYLSVVEAARRLDISEKTIRRAIHAGKLAARYPQPNRCEIALSDLEAWRQPQAQQDEAMQRITELERRVADLERQLQRVMLAQQAMTASSSQPLERSGTKTRGSPRASPPVQTTLPDHLVTLPMFADRHGISRNETERRRSAGFIHAVKGSWIIGKHKITAALDAQGRHDFWVQFHASPGFQACNDCPHSV